MIKTRVLSRISLNWQWVGAGLSTGLFVGRIVSEILRPGILGAVLITLTFIVAASYLLKNRNIRQIWPSYLLLIYVFYPEPDPRAAALVGLFSLLTYIIANIPAVNERVDSKELTILFALATGLIFLLLYGATLASDVLPADSGEFQLVGTEFGVAHPPGFPLYTIAANLISRLPIGQTPAYRINFLSVLISAAALIFVFLTVKKLSGSILGSVIAAGALGTATTFWSQATTANIRSLTALFAAMAFYAFVQFRLKSTTPAVFGETSKAASEGKKNSPKPSLIFLLLLAVAFGITHHLSFIFIATILLIGMIATEPKLLKNPRFWLAAGLAAVIALLPLLYLPLRASAGAIGAPDNLGTIRGFINHVLALGFRGDFIDILEPGLLWERLKVMVNVMTFQFSPFLLVAVLIGLGLLLKKDWLLALLIGGSFLLHTLISAIYRAPQTVEYMMPAYIPAAILLGYGAGVSAKCAAESKTIKKFNLIGALSAVFVSALIIAVLVQLADHYRTFSHLHKESSTREYVELIFEGAPDGSVVLADWHWATPMWYLQEIENQRPDLDIQYVFPTDEPYPETWARRISEELSGGRSVIATHYNEPAYSTLPPSLPLGEAFYFGPPPKNLPEEYIELDLILGDEIQILGYKIDERELHLGEEIVLTLAWTSFSDEPDLSNIFGHIVDREGLLLAFDDQPVQHIQDGINLTQLRLTPRPGTVPGEYPLLVGAYGLQPLPDKSEQIRTPITTVQIAPSPFHPITSNPVYRELVNEIREQRMIGYDWDNTLESIPRLYLHWQNDEGFFSETFDPEDEEITLPEYFGPWGISVENRSLENRDKESHYVPFGQGIVLVDQLIDPELRPSPGDQVNLKQEFVSTIPLNRDLVVSLRLVGYEEDGVHWDWWDLDDSVPAMGAIPTLKWIAGSRVVDSRVSVVSDLAADSQVIGPLLRLYDAFSQEAIQILDERIAQEGPWVPLGRTAVDGG